MEEKGSLGSHASTWCTQHWRTRVSAKYTHVIYSFTCVCGRGGYFPYLSSPSYLQEMYTFTYKCHFQIGFSLACPDVVPHALQYV